MACATRSIVAAGLRGVKRLYARPPSGSPAEAALSAAGFHVHHSGYWNSLLFPLMALHRLTAGKIQGDSDIKTLPDWQNALCYRIIRCEQFLQHHRIHIPFGGSVWAWASKP